MRSLKKARYFVLAAALLVIVALAACGGGNTGGNGGGGYTSSSVPTDGNVTSSAPSDGNVSSSAPSDGNVSSSVPTDGNVTSDNGSVTGTVTWPDGNPAANASIYFENRDLAACINNPNGFTGVGWSVGDSCNYFYQYVQLPAAGGGSYSLQGCPCADLTAYLYVPGAVMTPANGGSDCFIIMQDNDQNNQNYQNYSGFQANPGDVIDWQALDIPCSDSWYASDPSAVQSVATQPPPFNSGPWQTAEQLTSGGGSGS